MSKLRVNCFSISLDGYGAGPDQDLKNPLGRSGESLHEWQFQSRHFRKMLGQTGGSSGIDDDFVVRGFENVGAWIIGRNMFGPVRGPWRSHSAQPTPTDNWRGWWGDNPPFHRPVFVLSHYLREPIVMEGGTTFHFVSDGIESALAQAHAAAKGADIRLGGGVATLRAYLQAGLVDSLHLAVCPVLLGAGEHLFAGLDLAGLGYRVEESVSTATVMHVVVARSRNKV